MKRWFKRAMFAAGIFGVFIAVVIAALIFTPSRSPYRVGDQIMVAAPAFVWNSDGTKQNTSPGQIYTVLEVRPSRVRVSESGWVYSHQIVKLDESAIEIMSRYISKNPDMASLYSGRADAFRALGKLDAAMADYDTAVRLEPENPACYNNRGAVFEMRKEYERALSDYDQAIKLNPNYSDAIHNRARLRSRL